MSKPSEIDVAQAIDDSIPDDLAAWRFRMAERAASAVLALFDEPSTGETCCHRGPGGIHTCDGTATGASVHPWHEDIDPMERIRPKGDAEAEAERRYPGWVDANEFQRAGFVAGATWAREQQPEPETVTTVAELDALPVGSVVVEGDHTTPDPWIIDTVWAMPGVFHRFPDGWYVVAGHGARDVPLPAAVIHRPTGGRS